MQTNYIINEMPENKEGINELFSMLDRAIDDLNNGRTLSEEEMWASLVEARN